MLAPDSHVKGSGARSRWGEESALWRETTPTRGMLTIEDYVRYLANHDREYLAQLQTIRAVVAH
jgi:hypothetical protein